MEQEYDLHITGSGTIDQIVKSLESITNSVAEMKGETCRVFEDSILNCEIDVNEED